MLEMSRSSDNVPLFLYSNIPQNSKHETRNSKQIQAENSKFKTYFFRIGV